MDTLLFPLDTLKTRLQSPQGFKASGGFSGIYRGLSSAVMGSAPSAAMFFLTYDRLKQNLGKATSLPWPIVHMIAASGGEITACLIRVPTEVLKQRLQAKIYPSLSLAFSGTLRREGPFGLYRGFLMTIFREVVFFCF